MLREFLHDFEEKLELQDEPAAGPLGYPSALPPESLPRAGTGAPKTAGASARSARPSTAPPRAKPAPKPVRKPAAKGLSSRPKPSAGGGAFAPAHDGAPLEKAEAASIAAKPSDEADASIDDLNLQLQATAISTAISDPSADAEALGLPEPPFNPAHWTGADRPSTAPARGAPTGFEAPSSSRLPPSYSGFIHSAASGAPARRKQTDPVAMHARRAEQWRSDSFLAGSPNRRPSKPPPPAPPSTVQASRINPNRYVVPTTKRRDALVWETRQRLRESTNVPIGGSKQKKMAVNRFVPPTEKRRDALRWAVRAEMAYVG